MGGGEWASEGCAVSAFQSPHVDPETIMRSPVLTFILAKRELPSCRQKMDAAVRINTIRQYAFEVSTHGSKSKKMSRNKVQFLFEIIFLFMYFYMLPRR